MDKEEYLISDAILAVARVWLLMACAAVVLYCIVRAIERHGTRTIYVYPINVKRQESHTEKSNG